jgi:glycosyltransferase involved in cell wall biosynthesis
MSTPKMALVGGLAARMAGVPHRLYTLRGLRYETTRAWKRRLLMACERIACACAHRVICVSRSVREAAVRDGIAPREKLVLLGERGSEGIAMDLDRKIEGSVPAARLREQLGIPQTTAVIGFVGRLTRDKGIYELMQCFEALRRERRQVRLLVLGEFEPGDPVDAETAAWIRTSPDVHWLGFVARPEPYYPVMDVFVFPTYREGLPKVLLEAASAGTPVVSTLTTGVVDVVADGVTGILVPPGDAAALARAAGRLLDDRELAARMGRAARKLMEEHFDNTVYLTRLGMLLAAMAGIEPAGADPMGLEPMRTARR